jgi:hypothetical protein
VSHGGVLGVNKKLFTVPWSAFRLDAENHDFILNVDKDVLKNAEGFDKNHWPNVADRTWGLGVHQHYGATPYWDQL